jgi:hypothetical protein
MLLMYMCKYVHTYTSFAPRHHLSTRRTTQWPGQKKKHRGDECFFKKAPLAFKQSHHTLSSIGVGLTLLNINKEYAVFRDSSHVQ